MIGEVRDGIGVGAVTTSVGASPVRTRRPAPEPIYRTIPTPPTTGADLAFDQALARAKRALLALQKPDGHWWGELQGDSILESEYLLLKWILGQEDDPALIKIANYL